MNAKQLSIFALLALLLWRVPATAANKITTADIRCPYRLVAIREGKERTYALLPDDTKMIAFRLPTALGIDGDTPAEKLLSQATDKALAKLACEVARLPGKFAASRIAFTPGDLLAPIPQPENIVAVGLNYAAHNEEVDIDDVVVFPKNVAITAPNAAIPRPPGALLDWEVELGVVVRKEIPAGTKLTEANASEFIAGYVLANDVTNRIPIILDLDTGFTKGKTHPGFLPVGPYFMPIENLLPGQRLKPALGMQLDVNGEVKQRANTREMQHGLDEILALIEAKRMTIWEDAAGAKAPLLKTTALRAGDLLVTGTPGGTAIVAPRLLKKLGLAFRGLFGLQNPKWVFATDEYCSGKYLRAGDRLHSTIDGLGSQQNLVTENEALEPPIACRRRDYTRSRHVKNTF